MIVTVSFHHHRTNLVSIGGNGGPLPEVTALRVEVDETKNPAGAPAIQSSYVVDDLFGLAIGWCHWCGDLKSLGDVLTYLVWEQAGKPLHPPAIQLVVTKIEYSSFHFTNLGELGDKPVAA